MRTYDKLLAKSRRDGCEITLAEHTRQVIEAAETLFGTRSEPTRLGRCWLRFFNLNEDHWPAFHANLLAACALHDWGKANDGFQDAVRGKPDSQTIRHEHLSALLIGLPEIGHWLQGKPHLDLAIVLSAVLTHHLKAAASPSSADGFAVRRGGRKTVQFLHNHDDFRHLLTEAVKRLGPETLDSVRFPEIWRYDQGPTSIYAHRERLTKDILRPLRMNWIEPDATAITGRQMLLAVRVGLIAADAAGSALVRQGKTSAWIQQCFGESPYWSGKRVFDEVIHPRIAQINEQFTNRGQPPFQWDGIQSACDDLPRRALLLAPCGSGKTLAAWRWIAAQADRNPVNRVIFLYPTRATAKEGFRDYVSWAPEAALMHSTAAFDLHDMFDNESDPRHGMSYEAERRMFALGFWPKRAFSATVDQFLAFMQYSYSAICMLPVLADSVLVVDEVHSFDRHMFSALKHFLRRFDIPVLCMTATLTQDRRSQLEECGLHTYDKRSGKTANVAEQPRYRLTVAESRDAAAERVRDALKHGRRVLWVVNTVARCQEIVSIFAKPLDTASPDADLRTQDGQPIYCYHSRYRLADRIGRHRAIVDNLKPGRPACLGVTTQVCEMSLDLDVDLLVTEKCPVTSLIQRMGRCNRAREARSLLESGEVIVYTPVDNLPYSKEELTGWEEFLSLVKDRELSQADLEAALAAVPGPPWDGDHRSPFLTSGPYAVGNEESFRDSNDFSRECILFEDVRCYLEADDDKKPGFVVPVPRRWARSRDHDTYAEHGRLPRYLGVADAGHYHSLLGYCDQPLDQWRAQ